ncbi:MAG: DNA polymerase III subunit alpha, partial [Nitratireductor sp.]|nr:DNA polymerase III subunit alpha [Nitratireductor sp.]
DFDIDFCQERREEVIRYVQDKYGRDQVAQIITFGTLQARAVLRDVGRVLQMPYGQVDRIAKLVPANPANPVTLRQAIDMEPRLQEAAADEEIVARLFDIAMRLEGLYRHASTHAAGIVIGDRRLDELVPLYRDPRSDMPVTQFNMKWVEQAGLVKFDFLGLKTLSVLEKAVEFVAQHGEAKINLLEVPIDDTQTYAMLTRGETVGIFQLESAGMRKALIGMKPDRFEDIIALVALYRPGPMENIPVYNARKNGEEQITSIHPKIDHLVAETQGVIVYQEQVMQIAQELAGYSLGEADVLRRAMGKKIRAEMDKQRGVFVKGATERGITKSQADQIFDLLAKFADYGFNKSHAAAYALVSYHTAYMKAHHPVEFLAASMQFDMSNTDKLAIFRDEAKTLGIEVVAPSVQTCNAQFSVRDGKIFYALAAIKGVGAAAVEHIVAEREAHGEFASLSDLFSRIDVRQVNKRTIESLISAGALDCFGFARERMLAGIDRLAGHAQRIAQDRDAGQNDMFGGAEPGAETIELPTVKPWLTAEKLQREFQAMGFYLSAHPLDEYRELMKKNRIQLYAAFEESVRAGATAGRLAGTVTARQERKTRTGKRMGIVMLSDPSGQYEAILFDDGLHRFRDMLEPGRSVILLVNADLREEGVSLRIQSVDSLEAEAARETRNLRIYLRDDKPVSSIQTLLRGSHAPARGDSHVSLVVIEGNGEMEVEMQLPDRLKLTPQHANAIKSVQGVLQVELV